MPSALSGPVNSSVFAISFILECPHFLFRSAFASAVLITWGGVLEALDSPEFSCVSHSDVESALNRISPSVGSLISQMHRLRVERSQARSCVSPRNYEVRAWRVTIVTWRQLPSDRKYWQTPQANIPPGNNAQRCHEGQSGAHRLPAAEPHGSVFAHTSVQDSANRPNIPVPRRCSIRKGLDKTSPLSAPFFFATA